MKSGADARESIASLPLAGVACVFGLLVLGTAFVPGYEYMADELYYLSCADHLAWGYVDHPPFSIGVLAALRGIVGDSIVGLRLIAAIFSGATVLAVGALARELGGGRAAQTLAALAWVSAPAVQGVASFFSMNVIECFLWSVVALLVARIGREGGGHRWYWVGLVLGIALLNKLSTLWLGAGLALGVLLTEPRIHLADRRMWSGAAIATVLFLPHVVWQVENDWPLIDFIRGYAEEVAITGNVLASPAAFLGTQILAMGPITFPIWLAGLAWYFIRPQGRRFRILAWMWVGVFSILLVSGRSQAYYLAPAFPILYGAGAVWIEQVGRARRWVVPTFASLLLISGLLVLPIGMPLLTPTGFIKVQSALGIPDVDGELPLHFRWRVGWEELADSVAGVYGALEPSERRTASILAIGFPAAGALDHFGPGNGLPDVIGTHNNYWLWGPGELGAGPTLIVAPPDHSILDSFADASPVSDIKCRFCGGGVRDELIFVAREPLRPLEELWIEWRDYR